jgi:uncharacterized protein (TIGR03435 family)
MDMTRTVLFAAIACFFPVFAVAQTAPGHLEFEVSSIRPAQQQDARVDVGMHIDGAQVRFNYLSVRDCMRIAWQVKDYQVVGPDWVGSDRFNITAKLPEGHNGQDQVDEMLQNLIKDRFKLTYHMDKKEMAVYALVAGKNGLKLKETPVEAGAEDAPAPKSFDVKASGSANGVYVDFGGGSYYNFADNKLVGHKLSMRLIVDTLSRYMDKPIVDMTGAPDNKNYDFSFDITPDDWRTMLIRTAIKAGVTLPPEALRLADLPIDSLAQAMDAVGLRMDSRKAPVDVIVIDQATRTPTEN